MSFQLTRFGFDIDTGHRLMNHAGKCGNLHGHRYRIVLVVSGPEVDDVGVVTDFSLLKKRFGPWVDHYWDHTMIFEEGDPALEALFPHKCSVLPNVVRNFERAFLDVGHLAEATEDVNGRISKPAYVLPYAPTAENIARYLFEEVLPVIFRPELAAGTFKVDHVEVWETPNCMVRWPAPPAAHTIEALERRIAALEAQ